MDARWTGPTTMDNSRYLHSIGLPDQKTLQDMVIFYATREVREELISDWPEATTMMERIVQRVVDLMADWHKMEKTVWHNQELKRGRRLVEWAVWRAAMSEDATLGPMYRTEAVVPFAIDLETLPRYGNPAIIGTDLLDD